MKLLPEIEDLLLAQSLAGKPSCRMGTLAASYFRTLAGNIPGGILRSAICIVAVTCATAMSTFTFG